MRIELTNNEHARELVRFLREQGCIAYSIEGSATIEALRPLAPAGQERDEISELLAEWLSEHPNARARAAD